LSPVLAIVPSMGTVHATAAARQVRALHGAETIPVHQERVFTIRRDGFDWALANPALSDLDEAAAALPMESLYGNESG
jgi:hypothetical protein